MTSFVPASWPYGTPGSVLPGGGVVLRPGMATTYVPTGGEKDPWKEGFSVYE